ncbi:uncharacterized protein Z519_09021 [Cladophialophora bantiana CBS 173.52]|uniref:FAD-binding domain-containing protein n=1 Tax=Cladophialophora bantiana (strain ATCC 10958 / CBS 173.52 / CDC B-1940 / NIH 8579) TaxID=1442370 RepID=A0A0D2EK49_CLAB1|nr:uncharacterized protein Z519_09021 [Cladophialophora bantiana CBS 173.52]KIW90376.1 hypothetical protein Z519_09021 [Cladophialophora bantiana CBS 173.52]
MKSQSSLQMGLGEWKPVLYELRPPNEKPTRMDRNGIELRSDEFDTLDGSLCRPSSRLPCDTTRRGYTAGCKIQLGCEVQDVNFDQASVILNDGSVIAGDIVVAADGLWSTLRDKILGQPSPPLPTGDLAYRMTLPADALRAIADQNVQELLRSNLSTVWLGPDRHCVLYPIRNRSQWSLFLMYDMPPASCHQYPEARQQSNHGADG